MSNLVGTLFNDRYQVLEVLGSGGTSVVYKAKDVLLNRLVTIKILREQFARDEKFVSRFRNEAQAVARLSHPNIVSIYDVAFAEGVHYLIMEYVEGGSLKEYLDQHGPLPIDESLDIFHQLLNALQHAHENNVIHRDIKPHNILLDVKHNVRVTDFGLAVTTTNLTNQSNNDVMGSVYYMSPEQIKGEQVTAATDTYSAGLLLYEMLCNRRPFTGESAVEIARQHLKGNVLPPHKLNPDIPTELSSFVMKAVRRDKQLRFADAGQMLAEFRAMQNRSRRVRVKPIILPVSPTVGGEAAEAPEEARTVRGWSRPTWAMEAASSSNSCWEKFRLGWLGLGEMSAGGSSFREASVFLAKSGIKFPPFVSNGFLSHHSTNGGRISSKGEDFIPNPGPCSGNCAGSSTPAAGTAPRSPPPQPSARRCRCRGRSTGRWARSGQAPGPPPPGWPADRPDRSIRTAQTPDSSGSRG